MRRRDLIGRVGVTAAAAVLGGTVAEAYSGARIMIGPAVAADTVTMDPVPGGGRAELFWSASTTDKVAALTFDDGPTELFTPTVLDVLAEHLVTASFFVIGELALRHPDLVRRARDAGHEIGNHSHDHISSAASGRDAVHDAMLRGADAVEQVTGRRPRWYRPPRGEVTSATVLAAARTGHDLALWSLVRDGGGVGDADSAGIAKHLVANLHPGAVVDLHDGVGRSGVQDRPDPVLVTRRRAEIAVLPQVLTAWQAAGYRFVTISELIPPKA